MPVLKRPDGLAGARAAQVVQEIEGEARPAAKGKMVPVTFLLPQDLRDRLAAAAQDRGLGFGPLLRLALTRWLKGGGRE